MKMVWISEETARVELYNSIQRYAAASGYIVECLILNANNRAIRGSIASTQEDISTKQEA